MSTELKPNLDSFAEERTYKALAPMAVASLGLGLLSVLAFFDWAWAVFPAVGIVASVRALRAIRSRRDELNGWPLAVVGLILSVVCWAGGWSVLAYQYATEVPPGYERISYEELQPNPQT